MEQQNQTDWRRDKVQELCSKGYSQREISQVLKVGLAIVNRDVSHREICLVGLTAITKEVWITSQQTEDKREKMQALHLAKDCYSMKLDLLTNATVVDDAIRFVSEKSKEKLKLPSSNGTSNEDDKEESNEPDYDEVKDQLEEEHEEETVEIAN